MPIRGRTPKECFDQFGDHVRALVAAVLGREHHVTISQGTDPLQRDMQLGPRGVDYVPIATRGEPGGSDGVVYFSLAQDLSVFKSRAVDISSRLANIGTRFLTCSRISMTSRFFVGSTSPRCLSVSSGAATIFRSARSPTMANRVVRSRSDSGTPRLT